MLTTKETAIQLGVTQKSVNNYIKSGELKALEVMKGKQREYRIKMADIAAFKKNVMQLPYIKFVVAFAEKEAGDIIKNEKIVKIINHQIYDGLNYYVLNVIGI